MKKSVVLLLVVALVFVMCVLVGCWGRSIGTDSNEQASQEAAQEEAAMVAVPDINGMWDPRDVLEEAGLVGVEIIHHGPTEGAGEIGEAYNQSPSAGTMVEKGSTVTYETWTESQ